MVQRAKMIDTGAPPGDTPEHLQVLVRVHDQWIRNIMSLPKHGEGDTVSVAGAAGVSSGVYENQLSQEWTSRHTYLMRLEPLHRVIWKERSC